MLCKSGYLNLWHEGLANVQLEHSHTPRHITQSSTISQHISWASWCERMVGAGQKYLIRFLTTPTLAHVLCLLDTSNPKFSFEHAMKGVFYSMEGGVMKPRLLSIGLKQQMDGWTAV